MIYVALALAAVLAVTVSGFLRLLGSLERRHATRVDLLINELLHAAGKPWRPAPADTPAASAPPVEPPVYMAAPEQFPVY